MWWNLLTKTSAGAPFIVRYPNVSPPPFYFTLIAKSPFYYITLHYNLSSHCSPSSALCFISTIRSPMCYHRVRVHTCMMCGGICLGDRANDVEVLEQNDASCRSEVWGRPIQPFHSSDGYPGLTGLQHHHHSINVWDGDTCVLTEAPGKDTEVKNPGGWNGNDRETCSKGSWPRWQMVWAFSGPQQLSLNITWPHWFVTCHSNKEERFEGLNESNVSKQSQIKGLNSELTSHVIVMFEVICKS